MKIKINQPTLNILHAMLNASGWTSDLGEFYLAGKLLATLPKPKYLIEAQATDDAMAKLIATEFDIEIPDKERDTIKNALKGWVAAKKSTSDSHVALMDALGITP